MTKPNCHICKRNKATISAIVAGKYYKDICNICHSALMHDQRVSSGAAEYNRARDLEDHEADVQQPYVGGKPNPAFIRLYPDKAKELFTPDELRWYG